MKIITIHADHIKYKPIKRAIKNAEKVDTKETKVEECLVVLISVEKCDEDKVKEVAEKLADEASKIADQVNTRSIVLYPYAHLSSDLSHPDKAIEIIKEAEQILKNSYNVKRAPFGWYKSFELSCKGHPLSELSRAFSGEVSKEPKKDISKAVEAEKKLKSSWYVLDEKGNLSSIKIKDNKIEGFNFSKHKNLEKFALYELAKSREVKQEPPHIKIMKKLELVDYEPGSDPGNLRFYPKGRLIKSLLEQWVTQKTLEYGAVEVETPVMYDYEHPSLKSYMHRFPARQYVVNTPNKKTFLRFSACFGQFLIAHDSTISYKHLPLKLYELTRYSFRAEQSGELAGLRRLRAFTMPDCHCLVKDLEQLKEEMKTRLELSKSVLSSIGFVLPNDFEMGVRITKDFFEKNKDFVLSLIKIFGKPVLLEMWEEKFFYFVLKYELNFVDNLGKAAALSTDQVDVENAERYGIKYTDKDGKNKFPIILHLSPSGAIERVMYALLEKAYSEEKQGKLPILPLWLSPTQVRIVPVSIEKHFNVETINKRVRNAELEWVPIVLVVGDKEAKGEKLTVRTRESKQQKQMTEKELIKEIKEQIKGMPFRSIPLPRLLSKRPTFVG